MIERLDIILGNGFKPVQPACRFAHIQKWQRAVHKPGAQVFKRAGGLPKQGLIRIVAKAGLANHPGETAICILLIAHGVRLANARMRNQPRAVVRGGPA